MLVKEKKNGFLQDRHFSFVDQYAAAAGHLIVTSYYVAAFQYGLEAIVTLMFN